ncbi:MAG: OsmC family protein [Dehalococcoidia bacterium]
MAATVVLRSVGERYTTQVTTQRHSLVADEPAPAGDDLGPTPYELLLGALGSCTSMTLLMYARRQGWPLTEVQIELSHQRDYMQDCEDCENDGAKLEAVVRRIHLEGALSEEQRARLMEIARRCPVGKTLESSLLIVDAPD